jgi:hypothetical protein
MMAEPARITGIYSCDGVYVGHVRVVIRCSCAGRTDLTYRAGFPPAILECDGCGRGLRLREAVMGEMDPEDLERGTARREATATASAEDAEHAYDRARFGILSARAALMQYAAPLPDLTVTIPNERWETVRKADAIAGEAERKMEEALEVIRTGLLGWPPPEPPGESSEGGEDG